MALAIDATTASIWAAAITAVGGIGAASVTGWRRRQNKRARLAGTQSVEPKALPTRQHGTDKRVADTWESFWGPTVEDVRRYREHMVLEELGDGRVRGRTTRADQTGRVWAVEGRYDGHRFLQLNYVPEIEQSTFDFVDYGCYFLEKQGDGSFKGYSSGWGPSDSGGSDGMTVDHHLLVRSSR